MYRDTLLRKDEIKNSVQFEVDNETQTDTNAETNRALKEDDDEVLSEHDDHHEEISEDAGTHDYQLTRDRVRRSVRMPNRFGFADIVHFALNIEQCNDEPRSYKEAVQSIDKEKWEAAMKEEINSLNKNNTWDLIKKPVGKKVVSCKWLFKLKEGISETEKARYKARLVARGFTQKEGVDYTEIFSPVVKHTPPSGYY